MAAASTDKFKKGARKWVGQIGAGGVADASVTTIPLASSTGLPTDTGVVAVIDRVDSAGTKTPSLEETVIGVVSGDNLVTSTRGAEGTAQAHSAGAVVEILITNKGWNDMVDGILVGHNQDGTHKSGLVFTLPQINDTSSDHQYVFSVCELVADRTVALPLLTGDDEFVFKAHTQTLTNKTLTSPTLTTPVINGAVTGTMTPPLTFYASNFNAPEGFLINGKIVPSVASNNLTVAIKGMDGNDPSASNPVYIRIGDTVRAITSALSVTKNAGTNWCNAGSSELATKEIDYFVYIGYNATDGVVVGFSRIPYATLYSDFSATTTNEKYCAISTITNAAAGDNYRNIGRFAATLSAGAGYTWSVPSFTATNLVQRPIFETRWCDWLPTYGGTASMTFGTVTTHAARYSISGRRLYAQLSAEGTTGGTASYGITSTLPMTPLNSGNEAPSFGAFIVDGTGKGGTVHWNSAQLEVRKYDGSNYGLGAARKANSNIFYEI